jgi:integrase/recombinase XerD
MLIIYRRRNRQKCRFTSQSEFRCKCPIWVTGTKDGRRVRKALKLRDWNRAQELVREWDVEGTGPKKTARATIEEWRDSFTQDAKARHFTESTLRLYRLLFKQVVAFAADKGFRFVDELNLSFVTEFRSSWTNLSPLTASKRLERLRSIYKFALQRKMIDENYALLLASPKVKQNPTLPFSQEQTESDKVDSRAKAFILTMRYSGLRISDVATFATDSLKGNRLKLYQAKTGSPFLCFCPKRSPKFYAR